MLPIAPAALPVGASQAAGMPAGASQTSSEYFLTIESPGKPPQKCRPLRRWKMADGTAMCDVQDLATGEVFTICDTMPRTLPTLSAPPANMANRGNAQPGTLPAVTSNVVPRPVGPASASGLIPVSGTQAATMPPAAPAPLSTAVPMPKGSAQAVAAAPHAGTYPPAGAQQTPPEYTITVQEAGKPPQKCRPIRNWTMPDGTPVRDVQDVATGETMTILDNLPHNMMHDAPSAPMMGVGTSSRIFHWGTGHNRPDGVPMPPGSDGTMVMTPGPDGSPTPMVVQPAKKSGGLLGRWFGDKTVQSHPMPQHSVHPANGPALPVMANSSGSHPEADAGIAKGGAPGPDDLVCKPEVPDATVGCVKPSNPTALMAVAASKPFNGTISSRPAYTIPTGPESAVVKHGDTPSPNDWRHSAESPVVKHTDSPQPSDSRRSAESSVVKHTDPPQPSDWRRSWGKPDNWQTQSVQTTSTGSQDKVKAPNKFEAITAPARPFDTVKAPAKPFEPGMEPLKPIETVKAPPPPPPVWPDELKPQVASFASPKAIVPPRVEPVKPVEAPKPVEEPKPVQTVQIELPHADMKKPDPLMKSENIVQRVEKKEELKPIKEPEKVAVAQPEQKPAAPAAAGMASTQRVPLGAASVLAAASPGQVIYVPVPVVTIPGKTAPQQVIPQQPANPIPVSDEQANAFTNATQGANEAVASNAFSSGLTQPPAPYYRPQMPQMPQMPYPPMMAMGSGNGPPQMYNGPMAPSPVMQAGGYPNPYAAMAYQRPMMMPAYPNMVMPVSYPQPMPAAMPASYPQQSAAPAQNAAQMMLTLKDALYPSHREWAAEGLGTVDWRTNPQVVDALLLAAREDPAATVRAGCVRTLGKMNANTTTVVSTLQGLRSDADPRVRQDVDQALTSLGSAPQSVPAMQPVPAVQPVGGLMPMGTK
jgi:hypothetical protein